jgi:hypothetical protein
MIAGRADGANVNDHVKMDQVFGRRPGYAEETCGLLVGPDGRLA